MAAPKGNRYGVDSGNFFKRKAYTVEEWKEVFIAYLEDRAEKKWYKNEAVKSGNNAGEIIKIPNDVPLSIESFCVFANISKQTFYNYESAEGYQEYFEVTTRIREVIESDQLDGAMLGVYNPNIVARKLGLAENQNINQNVSYKDELKKIFDEVDEQIDDEEL